MQAGNRKMLKEDTDFVNGTQQQPEQAAFKAPAYEQRRRSVFSFLKRNKTQIAFTAVTVFAVGEALDIAVPQMVNSAVQTAQSVAAQPEVAVTSAGQAAQGVAVSFGSIEAQLAEGTGWVMQQVTSQPFDFGHAGPFIALAGGVLVVTMGYLAYDIHRTKKAFKSLHHSH
jgi:hypothetical protein